jgi:hypothetical protein
LWTIPEAFVTKFVLSAAGAAFLLLGHGPAHALTMKECSAKYEAAKNGGVLERHEVERLPQS